LECDFVDLGGDEMCVKGLKTPGKNATSMGFRIALDSWIEDRKQEYFNKRTVASGRF
jgi:hypothetical protein